MAVFKCKMCGGALEIVEAQSIVTCEYCGTQQTLPKVDDEKKLNLFNRANNLRLKSEFDKAAGIYESILAEFPEEAEAFWGLVLCKYGIEYVDDKDGKKIPTCHRTLPTPIMKDEDFQQACENADMYAKGLYREEAKAIDGIQKKILEIAATEEPYDIFICYKETDDMTGARTEDSSIAQDIYTALTEMGYKVFYARNSLRRVAGTEYDPYIYAALSTAKIMLAIGTKFEYYDAVWVKNEWSRFISMMGTNPSKVIIPCFKNIDAYDIPEEFSNMQALNMADMMFFNSLEASVKRVLPLETKTNVIETSTANTGASATVDSLLKRAFMFLEDGQFESASDVCEKVLDIDFENAQAYLIKLMVDLKLRHKEDFKNIKTPFNNNYNYKKFILFGDNTLVAELQEYSNSVLGKLEQKRKLSALLSTRFSASTARSVMVHLNGTVVVQGKKLNTTGGNGYAGNESYWGGIIAVSAGENHTIGLKANGKVIGAFDTPFYKGQCDVSEWNNVVAISTGSEHTVALKSDGTVVAAGNTAYGRCDVYDWTDVVAISAGYYHTVGLKSNGTVLGAGDNGLVQRAVSDWSDIVSVAAGHKFTVGLKSDGTVVAVGRNDEGQCNVSDWTDIVAVAAGFEHTVGLKSDGTVVAVGSNRECQCNVRHWTDIIAIAAGWKHTIGLKSDGTFVGIGSNGYSERKVENWKLFENIATVENEIKEAPEKMRIAENEKEIRRQKMLIENRQRMERQQQLRSQGLCQYCGGEFKGLLSKKCVKCGKPKDY